MTGESGKPLWRRLRRTVIGWWIDALSPWLNARAAGLLRPLPVSSRRAGPPKGTIRDLENWVQSWEEATLWTERGKGNWILKVRGREWVSGKAPVTLEPEVDRVFRERFRYWCPELSVTHLRDARMALPQGAVISPDDRVFEAFTHNYGEPLETHPVFGRARLPRLQRKEGLWATIICPGAHHNVAHWIMDCLPRLGVLEEAGLADQATFVVPARHEWYAETLGALGYGPDRYRGFGVDHWEFEHLLVPSMVSEPDFVRPSSTSWLRRRLGVQDLRPKGERLYISRSDARWRRVVNEDEVVECLRGEGFRPVRLENLSFREQVDLFSRAEYIVGPHGAGMANLLFAPVGARVVELFAPRFIGACFYGITIVLGQPYAYLVGAAEGYQSHTDFDNLRVDPERLLRTMRLLDQKAV
jgi:hypothetical protein